MAEVYKKAPEAFPGNPIEEIKNRIYVSPFYEEGIDDLINLIGVDQVLYGSDYPHPGGPGGADPLRDRARAPLRWRIRRRSWAATWAGSSRCDVQ